MFFYRRGSLESRCPNSADRQRGRSIEQHRMVVRAFLTRVDRNSDTKYVFGVERFPTVEHYDLTHCVCIPLCGSCALRNINKTPKNATRKFQPESFRYVSRLTAEKGPEAPRPLPVHSRQCCQTPYIELYSLNTSARTTGND